MTAARALVACGVAALMLAPGQPAAGAGGGQPLGDGRLTTSGPRPGFVYACSAPRKAGPARSAPWIVQGRYRPSRRPVVDGGVRWRSASFSLQRGPVSTTFEGNGQPLGTRTGVFPPLEGDDAARYASRDARLSPREVRGSFPSSPTGADRPSCLTPGEQVGVALDGAPIVAPFDERGRDLGAREVTDRCGGHTNASGLYLYRAGPACLGDRGVGAASGLVGYARDGFPIYGPRGGGGKLLHSADLDACHGRVEQAGGGGSPHAEYRYRLTADYPYTIGCFHGAPAGDWSVSRPSSAAGGVEAGPVTVRSDPKLFPAFDPAIGDYVTHCRPETPVLLTFAASGATRVSVDGQPARSGGFGVPIDLAGGRSLVFSVDRGPDAGVYHVRCLPADFPGWTVQRPGRPEAGWYVLSVARNGFKDPDYTVVFDSHGVPVWWMRDPKGAPIDASLLPDGTIAWLTYRGGPYGWDSSFGYEAHRLDGSVERTYRTVRGATDIHEFQVLPDRHAMLISYRPRRHVDLSAYGKSRDAAVVDGEIQEVDRHGKLVWSWSTKDHIPLSDSKRWFPFLPHTRLPNGRRFYDVAHLNTIDPHGQRLVVSLRHTDAVYDIDKRTGGVVWKLGGTRTAKSLAIVDDPLGGSSFGAQHDARLSDDGRYLTVYDNRTHRAGAPRAVRYRIDTAARTATLVESVSDPAIADSACCGSARRLPGGDWVISWGRNALVAEYDSNGNRVLAMDFGPRSSYRAVPVLPGGLDPARLRAGMDAMAP